MFEGKYFDGKTAKAYTASAFIKEDGIILSLKETGESLYWKFEKIEKFQKQNTGTTFYYGDQLPHTSFLIKDPAFLELLEKKAKAAPFLKNIHYQFEKKGKWAYAAAIAGTLAFLLFFNFAVLPYLAKVAAKNVPLEIEQDWGDEFFITFKQFNKIDSLGTIALQDFAKQLHFQSDYTLRFYLVESEMVNAFALPGGRVVVFTGIINKMENYQELAGLLGHEVGHVVNRHALKNIFNQYSHSYILKLLLGNGSEVLGAIGQSASQLSLLANSRQAEAEADAYGLNILNENKVDPKGMLDLFKALQEEKDTPEIAAMEMISTHPNMEKRIATIEKLIAEQSFQIEKQPLLLKQFITLKAIAKDSIPTGVTSE